MNNIDTITFSEVSRKYTGAAGGRVCVFSNFNLDLRFPEAGEIVAVLGASGSGKTTLLNLISGADQPNSGTVTITPRINIDKKITIRTVPQGYTCFPWLTALQNVRMGLEWNKKGDGDQEASARAYLSQVGLADRADAYPKELSGGMKQRVAIARALATDPDLLLLDEPFGALDFATRSEMQNLLVQLWLSNPRSIVFVTHDVAEALLVAGRIIILPRNPLTAKVASIPIPFKYPRSSEILTDQESLKIIGQIRKMLVS